MPKPSKSPRLSPSSRKVLESVTEAIIPSEGPERPGASDVDLADRLIERLSEYGGAHRAFIAACWFWEFSPLLSGKMKRLSALPVDERTGILERWEHSRMGSRRWAIIMLKAPVLATFYNNPDIWPHIGYREGCLDPPAVPRGSRPEGKD